jgi:predicted RNase H-like HicB family nuclease
MTRNYLVVYERGPCNYSGDAPDVIGCGSVGDTLEEMRANMTEALEFHLEGLAEDGIAAQEAVTTAIDFSAETRANGMDHCIGEWLEVRLPEHNADSSNEKETTMEYAGVHPDAELNQRAVNKILHGAGHPLDRFPRTVSQQDRTHT